MITEPAPAKINLALHVRRRRPDGYHDIETLFAFCADGDEVRVEAAEHDSFTVSGPFASALANRGDNLVVRARDAFAERFGAPKLAIELIKNLPVASGIGGGSADAAAILRVLAWHVLVEKKALLALASELGADVPACLLGLTALGTGKGDALQPLQSMPRTPVLLVNPRVGVSTAAVFSAWDGVDRGGIAEGGVLDRARAGRNDLESPARLIAPVIGDVLDELTSAAGATLVRMSGSGATCFALFDDERHRDAAAKESAAHGWWTLATTLG